MNVQDETVVAVTDVSIPQEVITAHVQVVTVYTTEGGAGVCYIAFGCQLDYYLKEH